MPAASRRNNLIALSPLWLNFTTKRTRRQSLSFATRAIRNIESLCALADRINS